MKFLIEAGWFLGILPVIPVKAVIWSLSAKRAKLGKRKR